MSARVIVEAVRRRRLVAILRSSRVDRLASAAEVLVEEGITTLELPLTSTEVLGAITDAVQRLDGQAFVGAGTVRTVTDARRAIEAGAAFLVSPNLSVPVIAYSLSRDVAVIPGVFTPTEVDVALTAGAKLLKLFPAGATTPDYLRLLQAPYPGVEMVPTGGVGMDEAPAWFAAGAVAVGVGTPLTGDSLESGDLGSLQRRARTWKELAS